MNLLKIQCFECCSNLFEFVQILNLNLWCPVKVRMSAYIPVWVKRAHSRFFLHQYIVVYSGLLYILEATPQVKRQAYSENPDTHQYLEMHPLHEKKGNSELPLQ